MKIDAMTAAAFKPSRFIMRALDRRKYTDYGMAFAVGAWPILLAYLIGAHWTIGEHVGYWEIRNANWWSLTVLLPLLLLAFRFAMMRIVPVGSSRPPPLQPPVIDLLREESAKKHVYEALRRCVLSKRNVVFTLGVTLIVHILDAPTVLGPYLETRKGDPSWANIFQVNPAIDKLDNLLLLVFAGIAQFSAAFLGILTIVLFFRHNWFFLGNVYQRRWVPAGKEAQFFQINPKDVNRCFGFRIANVAFNMQVWGLMIAGAAMFLSRYQSVIKSGGSRIQDGLTLSALFPLPTQWVMALSWLVALLVVALPAFVKLLPRIPMGGARRVELSISKYLHEFFSDKAWPKDRSGRDEPLQIVAARFAQNSFWPTGDNRARVLFFFAWWIFFVVLLPVPLFVTLLPMPLSYPSAVVVVFVSFAVPAYAARLATFAALRQSLRYVDELLVAKAVEVKQPLDSLDPQSDQASDIGVFISYRRRDSAPYARSLHERLLAEFAPERIFMDIADIGPGDNFVQRIDQRLGGVDAVIVVIGEKWLAVTEDGSRPRIEDPADMVHIEVATALHRGKRVFPVLVGGAKMPAAQQLPGPLQELAQLNAIELSDTRWEYDVGRLIDAVKAR
jgi:TIR domain